MGKSNKCDSHSQIVYSLVGEMDKQIHVGNAGSLSASGQGGKEWVIIVTFMSRIHSNW